MDKVLMFFFPLAIISVKKKLYLSNLRKSKFYRPFLNETLSFESLPIVNKKIFMQKFNDINTANINIGEAQKIAYESEKSRDFSPMINQISVGFSTGTSGNKSLFLVSENERAKWVAYILDRVVRLSLKVQKVAFFLRANNNLYESSNSKLLQFNFFDIFKSFSGHVSNLNDLKPDILIAQPSVLKLLSDSKKDGILKINPKKIISIAEVLTDEDKKYFEKIFSVKIDQVYQCAEGFLAHTCSEGKLHFNEDFLIIEKNYVDEKKTKFHPIITDLSRNTQPIARYELNDIITEDKKCKCGSKFLAIKNIEGRSDDTFKFLNDKQKEILIFPDLLRRSVVMSDNKIVDYQIIQKSDVLISLYIKSKDKKSFELAKKSISNCLENLNINKIDIIQSNSLKFKIGDKKRRVINENKK